MNKSLLANQLLIPIHDATYKSIDLAVEEWIVDSSFELWQAWESSRKHMGDFLVVLCGVRSIKNKVHTKTAKDICTIWGRFRKEVAQMCTLDDWTEEERTVVEEILVHPIVCGESLGVQPSLSRIAEFLELPISEKQIDEAIKFLERNKPLFLNHMPKNTLDLLISTEFHRDREGHS
jgi:hypothetical protein